MQTTTATKPIKSIVISNIMEFNRRAMQNGFTDAEYQVWDASGTDLSDMALFWGGDDKLLITQNTLNMDFVQDVITFLGYENIQLKSPSTRTTSICEDIVNDTKLFGELVDILKESDACELQIWGATAQFYSLLDALRQEDLKVIAPGIPLHDSYWTALYLESKAGFRDFIRKLQLKNRNLLLPYGFVCTNKVSAIEAIRYYWNLQKEFVLKANFGTGGVSNLFYIDINAKWDLQKIQRDISHRMSFDHFWDNQPVILEEYIKPNQGQPSIYPTADFLVLEDGNVEIMGTGAMLMRRGHVYSGISCGVGALDPQVDNTIRNIGVEIGKEISALGYRGWFDIDFVVGEKNNVYMTEINARRASPAHVFEVARRLFGSDWKVQCGIYANDHLSLLGSLRPTYPIIREVFKDFEKTHSFVVRVLPTVISFSLQQRSPYLGYLIISKDANSASLFAQILENQIRDAIGMKKV